MIKVLSFLSNENCFAGHLRGPCGPHEARGPRFEHLCCTIQSHNGKVDIGSTNSRRVYSMSLLLHVGTNCACTHTYIPVSAMFQDNVMQLSKLLLRGYQFASVRIPMEYVVLLLGSRLAGLSMGHICLSHHITIYACPISRDSRYNINMEYNSIKIIKFMKV